MTLLYSLFFKRKPKPDPNAIQYGTFSHRMMAATLDICILLAFALPAVDYMSSQIFPPMDFQRLIDSTHTEASQADAHAMILSIWNALMEQQFIQRTLVSNLMQVACIAVYILPFWFRYSTTLGKMLFRLTIVDHRTHLPMSDKQCIGRFLGYFVSGLPFSAGFLWIIVDKRRRGFHDILAGTVVIRKPKAAQKKDDVSDVPLLKSTPEENPPS